VSRHGRSSQPVRCQNFYSLGIAGQRRRKAVRTGYSKSKDHFKHDVLGVVHGTLVGQEGTRESAGAMSHPGRARPPLIRQPGRGTSWQLSREGALFAWDTEARKFMLRMWNESLPGFSSENLVGPTVCFLRGALPLFPRSHSVWVDMRGNILSIQWQLELPFGRATRAGYPRRESGPREREKGCQLALHWPPIDRIIDIFRMAISGPRAVRS